MSIIHKIRNSSANSCTNIDPKLQDLLDAMHGTSQQLGSQQLGGQQLAGQQIVISDSTGTHTAQSLKDFVDAMQATVQPLNNEEQRELTRLKEEYEEEQRQLKLKYFKALPAEFRQQVINAIRWSTVATEIDNLIPPKSERLRELEGRSSRTNPFAGYSSGSSQPWMGQQFPNSINMPPISFPIPEGLTIDDLEEAHLEATIEEEILNNELDNERN